jgi:hypothetical protein
MGARKIDIYNHVMPRAVPTSCWSSLKDAKALLYELA